MFLTSPPGSAEAEALYAEDLRAMGFVMNGSRLWAHDPRLHDELFALLTRAAGDAGLSLRQRGVLVVASASTLGDSYCSLAWGTKLAREADEDLAAAVLEGTDRGLTPQEQVLAPRPFS